MYRKDRVLEALRSLYVQQTTRRGRVRRHAGFSAEEVAAIIDIDRTNASRDLNLLAQEGMVERIPGRPVLFVLKAPLPGISPLKERGLARGEISGDAVAVLSPQKTEQAPIISASVQSGAVVTSFETLIGHNDGLKVAVQQAKAAILYPPRGLHTLLYGPSGVGKTTIARLMHAFALEQKALPPEAPFISFNCADYTGNPQLLLAHLFGVVRDGSVEGETKQKGLVEQANRGVLFLDEVHRLPPEGQEMLFYLMDHERFRRIGDVQERHSSLLLLAATTEDPHTALLPTFRRRIPMLITLPRLEERTLTERYELLRAFFTTECSTIGTNIHIAPQALRAFLLYECPGNIGQLRTDVQLVCARAYLDYHTTKQTELQIRMDILPEYIHRGLLRTAELQRTLAPVQQVLQATHIFTPTGLSLNSTLESTHNVYESLNAELLALRNSGLPEHEINKILQLDIQRYFQYFADTVSWESSPTGSSLVDERILRVAQFIIQLAEERLQCTFSPKLALVLSLHLSSAVEYAALGRQLTMSMMQSVQQTYPNEYAVAQLALQHIQKVLKITLPESEADVIAVLFAHADVLLNSKQISVGIVLAAHGHGVASGLAELANTLMGVNAISWVELPLDQPTEELLMQVEQSVYSADQGCGVLLLVDFTSLLSLEERIKQRTGIHVRAVAGVCAPLVVDALRRAQRADEIDLDQIATDLALFRATNELYVTRGGISSSLPVSKEPPVPSATSGQGERVLLSVCLTGYGSATKIAELLEERLPDLSQQGVEIMCMDVSLSEKDENEVQYLVGGRQVVAVVGTVNPHLEGYPFISLSELLFRDGLTRLRMFLGETLIDPAFLSPTLYSPQVYPLMTPRADLLRELSHTLSQRLLFLNPVRALPLIEQAIEQIEYEVGETFDIDVLAGLLLHLICVLEQGREGVRVIHEKIRVCVQQKYGHELEICLRAWNRLSKQIGRSLPEDEAYNIVGILKQMDIFTPNEV
ncbi:MAG TPA: sigma 54-interacting transcriptional regulator [Ktedonobacteraceae bacterium]